MSIADLRNGDVVRFARFTWQGSHEALWAVVGTKHAQSYKKCHPLWGDWPTTGGRDGYYFGDSSDDYKIIPPDKWPDKVCLAMAKRALMGENT